MKKAILTAAIVSMAAVFVQAQTTFWSDNFDAPSGGANNNNAGVGWTLNSGGTGGNTWFINTPTTAFGCTSSGNALHVSCSGGFCSFFGGPNEVVYLANGSNDRSAVSPDISTIGRSNINLIFNFKCQGIANQDYGTLAFSSDGGVTWNEQPGRFQSVSSCSTYTVSIPAQYENIPNFRLRFRWIESNASQGQDPSFGVDDIRLTATNASCTPPTVNAGSAVNICAGAQTTIGGSPTATGGNPSNYTYSWAPATGLSSTAVANPIASPSSTTTYTVTVSGGDANCTATAQVTVTVNTPTVSITPAGSTNICPGASVQLNATAGLNNYVWTTPSGTQSGQSISASAAGNYSVTAQDANGCPATSAPITITQLSVPALTISPAGPLNLCSGQSLNLTATAGFSNYLFTTPSGTIVGSSISATQAGNYFVTATAPNGCSVQSPITAISVVSPATLTVTFLGSLFVCPGDSATLIALPGFSNYVWSGPAGNIANDTARVSQPGAYTATAIDANGCQSTSVALMLNNFTVPALTVSPPGNINLCPGQSQTLIASTGFTGYSWNTPSGVVNGNSVTASQAGNYQAFALSANGCEASSTVITATVVSVPNLSISTPDGTDLCPAGSLTLNAAAGFTGYAWTTPSGTQNGSSIEATTAGNYSVSALFSGCQAQSAPVTINAVSVPTLNTTPSGLVSLCPGQTQNATGSPGFSNYQWTTPSGISEGNTVSLSAAGNYTLSAQFSGCNVSASAIQVALVAVPSLNISPAGPITACPGETPLLSASGGFSNYSWTTPAGQIPGTAAISASTAGNYTVSAEFLGCSVTSSPTALSFVNVPALNINASGTQPICPGTTLNLSASSGFSNYQWNTPAGNQTGNTVNASQAGNYTVSASISGCAAVSSPFVLSIVPVPSLSTTPQGVLSLCPGQSGIITASGGFDSYTWLTPSGGSLNATEINVAEAGSFSLSAQFQGCTATAAPVLVQFSNLQSLQVSVSGSTTLCPGQSVTLTAEPGFENYIWSNGSVGQSVTINSAQVISVGASAPGECDAQSADIAITQLNPIQPQIQVSGNPNFCPGISTQLSLPNGFSDVLWTIPGGANQQADVLSASASGMYTAQATDINGCTTNAQPYTLNFQVLPELAVLPGLSLSFCLGDSVQFTAADGFENYVWNSDGGKSVVGSSLWVSNSSEWTLSADFNGCPQSTTVQAEESNVFQLGISPSGTVEICAGESIALNAQAGFQNYQWSNGSTGQQLQVSSPGLYSVSAETAQGCAGASQAVNVVVNPLPVAGFTYDQLDEQQFNVAFSFTGSNADAWLWDFGGGNTSTEENPVHSFLFDDVWPVQLIVSNNCGSDTILLDVDVIKTGINAANALPIRAWFDGTNLQLTYDGASPMKLQMSLFDASGRILWQQSQSLLSGSQQSHNLPLGAQGIYILQLSSNQGSRVLRLMR